MATETITPHSILTDFDVDMAVCALHVEALRRYLTVEEMAAHDAEYAKWIRSVFQEEVTQ